MERLAPLLLAALFAAVGCASADAPRRPPDPRTGGMMPRPVAPPPGDESNPELAAHARVNAAFRRLTLVGADGRTVTLFPDGRVFEGGRDDVPVRRLGPADLDRVVRDLALVAPDSWVVTGPPVPGQRLAPPPQPPRIEVANELGERAAPIPPKPPDELADIVRLLTR